MKAARCPRLRGSREVRGYTSGLLKLLLKGHQFVLCVLKATRTTTDGVDSVVGAVVVPAGLS